MEKEEIESNSNLNSETVEYSQEKEFYAIKILYNKEIIVFNIKLTKNFLCEQYEEKYTSEKLKQINSVFSQFSELEKVKNLFINLFEEKKIKISGSNNILYLSFTNINGDLISLSTKKKDFLGDEKFEKLSEIVKNIINELKELKEENKIVKEENKIIKEENKKMKEYLNELIKFKKETEEEKKKLEEKYHNLKNSSILKNREKVKMISNWIIPNKKVKYELIYKATRDGGTGINFHKYCDYKGPTLTLIKTTSGYIFGGYTTLSWELKGDWNYKSDDKNAFIFSINNNRKYSIIDKSIVIYNRYDYGPVFGYNDIYVKEDFLVSNKNECHYNSYYLASPGQLAGGNYFQIKELEVYTLKFG